MNFNTDKIMRILPFLTVVNARLPTLAEPLNHFYDFSVDGVNPKNYKFAIFSDPQLGKEDKESGGDGTKWTQGF